MYLRILKRSERSNHGTAQGRFIHTLCSPKNKRPYGSDYESTPMETDDFHHIYNSVRRAVCCSQDSQVILNDDIKEFCRSLVCYLQLFSVKTSTTLISPAFIAYLIHVVLLKNHPKQTRVTHQQWVFNYHLRFS